LVAQLDDLLRRQRQCVEAGELDAYRDLDVVFHQTIWRGSGNRRLVAVSDNLLGQVRVGNTISARVPGRLEAALQEHSAIVEALRQGDAQSAGRATRQHVRRAGLALSKLLD
jgi:DNA-binding GntR family transcriptional regulator